MKLAVWNLPPVDLLTVGFSSGDQEEPFDIQRLRLPDCERVLLEGHVDVALLPTKTVLEHHGDLDVIPAVALSTWKYPFARVVLEKGLGTKARSLAFNPDYGQERFLAELLLREHYKIEPEFVPYPGADPIELMDEGHDAALLVGGDVPMMSVDGRALDLGQEWIELANYPMTWGLFAARKGEIGPSAVRAVRDAVLESERRKKVWLRATETSEPLHAFYADDLRFRLDDLCIAGMTELRQFLFYYDLVDDVRNIPFLFLPDDDAESDEGKRPLL
ncbi:MAG: MqnA/MqnD/SBP family protein [Rhodothermales bacterium]